MVVSGFVLFGMLLALVAIFTFFVVRKKELGRAAPPSGSQAPEI